MLEASPGWWTASAHWNDAIACVGTLHAAFGRGHGRLRPAPPPQALNLAVEVHVDRRRRRPSSSKTGRLTNGTLGAQRRALTGRDDRPIFVWDPPLCVRNIRVYHAVSHRRTDFFLCF